MLRLNRREFLAGTAAAGLLKVSGLSWANDDAMIKKIVPSSNEALPVIGLGTSRVFNVDGSAEQLEPLRMVVQELVAGGGSVIDTAPSYGPAEAVVGDLVSGLEQPEKVFLATKVAANGEQAGRRQIMNSLQVLKTEVIDLFQVHNLRDTKTQLGLLRELRQEGKIRYIGITHYVDSQHDELADWVMREPVDFVQLNYSIGDRAAEKTLLPLCADQGIATMINRPFERGRLFGRVRGKTVPDWAADFDCQSWGQFFLKYIAAHPAVTNIIPATANPRHMLDNVQAGKGRLPDAGQQQRMIRFFDKL